MRMFLHLIMEVLLLVRSLTEKFFNYIFNNTIILGNDFKVATLWAKQSCVLCGTPFFKRIFEKLGCTVEFYYQDGDRITVDESGRCQVLLL